MVRRFLITTILIVVSTWLLFCLAIVIGLGSAKIITVDDDGSEDYVTIQDAINSSEDGDTVIVHDGVYHENIIVNKSLDLFGTRNGITTINGSENGSVVVIKSNWVNVSGFYIIGSGKNSEDAGIKVESNHSIISNNTCSKNQIGIYLYQANDTIISNNICNGSRTHGIYLYDSYSNNLSGNNISSNAIWGLSTTSNFNNIMNNICMYNGGGILNIGDNTTISNNTISINQEYGLFLTGKYCKIINNAISGNLKNGMYLSYANYNILSTNVCSNNGYGVFLLESNNNIMANTTCSYNEYGISLALSGYNTFAENVISQNNIGISVNNPSFNNSIYYNKISNNDNFGIYNYESNGIFIVGSEDHLDELMVNATHNWWGNASGPYHPTKNPRGTGDNISDYIHFSPWLDEFGNPLTIENQDKEEHYDLYIFFTLIIILTILFSLLFIVVTLPYDHFLTSIFHSGPNENDSNEKSELTASNEINNDSFKPPPSNNINNENLE